MQHKKTYFQDHKVDAADCRAEPEARDHFLLLPEHRRRLEEIRAWRREIDPGMRYPVQFESETT